MRFNLIRQIEKKRSFLFGILLSLFFSSAYAQTYNKVLFVGNSITGHGPAPEIGWTGDWGMAASSKENDYVRKVMAEIRKTTPEATFKTLGSVGFEKSWSTFDYSQVSYLKTYGADLIIMRLGENVKDSEVESGKLRESYLRLLDAIAAPNSKIIITNSFWKGHDKFNAMAQSIATERSLIYVNLTDLSDDPSNKAYGQFSDPGVAEHPGDKGMAAIASRIISAIKTTTPETPTTPTVPAQSFKKVLFVGNSMTHHGPLAEIGWSGSWGMAASRKENDYLNRVMAEIKKKTPDATHDQMNAYGFETNWKSFNYDQIGYLKTYAADLVIIRFGENVNEAEVESGKLRESYLRLIDAVSVSTSKIVLTTTFWKNHDKFNAMVQSIASERKLIFVNLTDLSDDPSNKAYGQFSNPGVAEHPGDKGMAAIASRILGAVTTTSETPTTPENPTTPETPTSENPTTPTSPTNTGTTPRYLSLSILNVVSGDFYLPVIKAAADAGVNSFLLNVNWERIYSERGVKPDWSQIDKQADLAVSLGCKLMLRVWLARHNDGDQGWWPEATRPVSGDGIKRGLLGGFSFADANAVEEANAFVREVMEHFKARQQAGQILFVSVVTTNASEIGYTVDAYNPILKENTIQVFDYSYHSINAFREWAKNKYKTLANLNKAWNSDFSNFSDIWPPYVPNEPWSAHYYKIGEDWYLFRHWALKNLMVRFRNTVRQVDPTYKYYEDMGSCYDPLSIMRATLGFKDLCKDSDGLKINDALHYNHRFAMDLLRSNLPGKMIGNEFESISLDYRNEWKKQVDESFEHGADWVNIFGFDRLPYFYEVEPLVKETVVKWLNTPRQTITPTQTVTYTLSEAFKDGNTNKAQERWNAEYAISKKPIKVVLLEDMLGETTIANIPPTVKTPLTNQQATVNQWFQYEIPKTTFADADGFITGITATGLPEGLSLVDWRVEGKAFASGEHTINITAKDNAGATVTTSFKLSVVASPSDNVFSLFKAGNFLTRRFIRYIQNGDTLRGDAIKESINILVSPRTGTVGSYSFALSGPHSVNSEDSETPFGLFGDNGGVILSTGKYTLTVKSYVNTNLQGAMVSNQTIHFVVVQDNTPPNLPPVLTKPPVDQIAKVGKTYSYRISDSTFVDPDGTISSWTLTGLPDGLKGDGTLISGTPTKEGVYTVKVRATDNKGASSETTFKFTITASNLPPVAHGPIPDQTADINKPFSYTIPDGTFTDPDGQITTITVSGLPEGMSGVGKLISGVPKKDGVFTVTVTATDNANASVTLTFTLTVRPENQPPVLSKAPADQMAKVGKAYSYRIPDSTFMDPDGTISSWTLIGLPDGLKGDGTLISGTPTKEGVYTVTVRATDNKGASSETTFKFTVTAGNLPPVANGTIPNQTVEINKPISYTIPDNIFTDPDGQITGITLSGLPEGLSVTGKLLSGTPTKAGTYTVTVTATDNDNATAKLTFTLTVLPENKPPVLAKAIGDQSVDSNAVYRFVIPAGTFTDPDGKIVRLEIGGLPAGLTAKGDTIAGNPTKVGEFVVSVKAIDDRGGSVQTTFKLTVKKLNLPPVLSKPVSDLILIMGEVFYFDVSTYFNDPDGSIASVTYAATLPPGITANGSQLAGNPTAVGEYTVKVVATDDKGAKTEVTFKLIVQKPELRIVMYQADSNPKKKIREVANADIIPISTLPSALNIFVESNANITMVLFDMTGPVTKKGADEAKPFGLYGDEGSFKPVIGTYKLKVTGYRNTTEVVSRTIQFDVIRASNNPVRQGVEEFYHVSETELWKPYPNPFADRIHIRLAPDGNARIKDLEMFSDDGKALPLTRSMWKVEQSLLEINFSGTPLVPGMYLLRITGEDGKQRALRISRSPDSRP